jgi:hypothetical protein
MSEAPAEERLKKLEELYLGMFLSSQIYASQCYNKSNDVIV